MRKTSVRLYERSKASMDNISIQLHIDKTYILHEIESGKTARAFGTIKYLKQDPKGEKFGLNWR